MYKSSVWYLAMPHLAGITPPQISLIPTKFFYSPLFFFFPSLYLADGLLFRSIPGSFCTHHVLEVYWHTLDNFHICGL